MVRLGCSPTINLLGLAHISNLHAAEELLIAPSESAARTDLQHRAGRRLAERIKRPPACAVARGPAQRDVHAVLAAGPNVEEAQVLPCTEQPSLADATVQQVELAEFALQKVELRQSAAACRRGVASAVTSLLSFAALLLDWAHRLWPSLDHVAWLSPFYYFQPYELFAGAPLRPKNLLVLWAIAMSGYVAAYLVISRRDISR